MSTSVPETKTDYNSKQGKKVEMRRQQEEMSIEKQLKLTRNIQTTALKVFANGI
jgi:hypothetical protein